MGPFAEPNEIAPPELGVAMEEMRKRIQGRLDGMKFELSLAPDVIRAQR